MITGQKFDLAEARKHGPIDDFTFGDRFGYLGTFTRLRPNPELAEGYFDGRNGASPLPGPNRSEEYRKAFEWGREDLSSRGQLLKGHKDFEKYWLEAWDSFNVEWADLMPAEYRSGTYDCTIDPRQSAWFDGRNAAIQQTIRRFGAMIDLYCADCKTKVSSTCDGRCGPCLRKARKRPAIQTGSKLPLSERRYHK